MFKYNQRLYENVRNSSSYKTLVGILKKVSDANDANMDLLFDEITSRTPKDDELLKNYRMWAHNILVTYLVMGLGFALSEEGPRIVLTADDLKACVKLGEILSEFEEELDSTERCYLALLGLCRLHYNAKD